MVILINIEKQRSFSVLNSVYEEFSIVLVYVGILIVSCTGSISIKWYGRIETLIHISMPVATVMGFTAALFLTALAKIPYKNSKRFLQFWRFHLRKKVERKILRAGRQILISYGPYGLTKTQLGIILIDDMIQNMITLILLDGQQVYKLIFNVFKFIFKISVCIKIYNCNAF